MGHALPGEVLEYHKPAQVLTVQAVIAGKVSFIDILLYLITVVRLDKLRQSDSFVSLRYVTLVNVCGFAKDTLYCIIVYRSLHTVVRTIHRC